MLTANPNEEPELDSNKKCDTDGYKYAFQDVFIPRYDRVNVLAVQFGCDTVDDAIAAGNDEDYRCVTIRIDASVK